MKAFSRLAIVVPALVLVACLAGAFLTRGTGGSATLPTQAGGAQAGDVVDQSPWRTAQALAPLAVSAEEQRFAREAERLADHEVDQAFAQALRQAEFDYRVSTPEAKALQQKISDLKQTIAEDQANVARLTANGKDSPTDGLDDIDFAKAQMGLDQDELNDATEQLARMTGDRRGKIQQELAAHEAGMKKYDEAASGGKIASLTVKQYGTLWHRVGAFFDQRNRHKLLLEAQAQASRSGDQLRKDLQQQQAAAAAMQASPQSIPAAPSDPALPASTMLQRQQHMNVLKRISAQRSIVAIVGDRLQTEQQLQAEYGRWAQQVLLQHTIVTHLVLQSTALIAFIVLAAMLLGWLGNFLLGRSKMDHRRLHTLQTILDLAIQVVGLLLILLVIFGPPNQVPTILGLATAGLTVVFQDFILAFFGWFVLMGRNGIHVGDWVEINGVGGEVVEISLFRTYLLETGNWTDMGHPTGRSVTFINSFAINGHYFNFSTSGQWMWDEISVSLPAAAQSFGVVEQIHEAVERETSNDVELAEREWKASAKPNGLTQFSARPGVDLRPGAAGIDVMVRYVTRAGDRFETRNRLYGALLALLHGKDAQGAAMLQGPAGEDKA